MRSVLSETSQQGRKAERSHRPLERRLPCLFPRLCVSASLRLCVMLRLRGVYHPVTGAGATTLKATARDRVRLT